MNTHNMFSLRNQKNIHLVYIPISRAMGKGDGNVGNVVKITTKPNISLWYYFKRIPSEMYIRSKNVCTNFTGMYTNSTENKYI